MIILDCHINHTSWGHLLTSVYTLRTLGHLLTSAGCSDPPVDRKGGQCLFMNLQLGMYLQLCTVCSSAVELAHFDGSSSPYLGGFWHLLVLWIVKV